MNNGLTNLTERLIKQEEVKQCVNRIKASKRNMKATCGWAWG